MKKSIILAGSALVVCTGVALAQPADAPRFDPNANISRQQVIERVEQRFARLDANRDGRATRDEARQAGEQRRQEMASRAFDRLDLNHDGSVTRAEFDQARGQLREQRQQRRAERGPGMRGPGMRGPGMRGARRGGPGMNGGQRSLFGEQGFFTLEQMRDRALARFDQADANHDGTLTPAERQQAREQMRQRFRDRMQQRRGQQG